MLPFTFANPEALTDSGSFYQRILDKYPNEHFLSKPQESSDEYKIMTYINSDKVEKEYKNFRLFSGNNESAVIQMFDHGAFVNAVNNSGKLISFTSIVIFATMFVLIVLILIILFLNIVGSNQRAIMVLKANGHSSRSIFKMIFSPFCI